MAYGGGTSPAAVVCGRPCRTGTWSAYDAPYIWTPATGCGVVVYGQEGLTNTYAISAAAPSPLPLIGAVPARGRTPQVSLPRSPRAAQWIHREPSVAVEIGVLPSVLHPR